MAEKMNNTAAKQVKSESYFASVWIEFRKNKAAVVGMVILFLLVLVAIFAGQLAPYDPYEQVYADALMHPCREHLFGTDEFGRDIFSRVLYGARISLLVGVVSISIACVCGCLLGASAGYFGGT